MENHLPLVCMPPTAKVHRDTREHPPLLAPSLPDTWGPKPRRCRGHGHAISCLSFPMCRDDRSPPLWGFQMAQAALEPPSGHHWCWGGGGMLGNHARVLLMGGTGGLQTGGQGFLWMGGTQGSAEGGTGGQGAFHVGGSADRGDRAPVDGGDKSLCRPRGQGSLQKGGQGSL